jgi:drug/metabolite transporter (DMT)-like permease
LPAEDLEAGLKIDGPAARTAVSHPWRGYFYVAAATLCWGTAATVSKGLFQGRLFPGQPMISPLVLAQTRTSFAVLMLLPYLLLRNPSALRMPHRDFALCLLTGTLGLAGSNFFYYWAMQRTTVAVAITLQYTAPVWVLLAMVARGRQRATRWHVSAVILAITGTALTIGLFHSGIRLSSSGVAAAMIASFSFAFYNIVGQELVGRYPALPVMAYALLGAVLLWICVNPPARLLAAHYSSGQWMFLVGFALLATLMPYSFYFHGLKYLDPTRAVVTGCLEPVFAILLAMTFVHEGLAGLQVVGILAVLAATVLVQTQPKA